MSPRRRYREPWPHEVSTGFLARKAGCSVWTMRRKLRKIPKMRVLMDAASAAGEQFRVTLSQLRDLAPGMYDSIILREEMFGEDEAA